MKETQKSADDYVQKINNSQVYNVATTTPLEEAPLLSEKLGVHIMLKREDKQPAFSFKVRGATNKIFSLDEEQIRNGVICSSAGNHAQGMALAAAKRGVAAHIVMPASTPTIKVAAVEALGGKVTLHGDHYDDAQRLAKKMADEQNLYFVHPFDDPDVIAGQGTIGREILEQANGNVGAVFIPIGGGGLAAGIATYIKTQSPGTMVYGVEPKDAASMVAAFANGGPIALDELGIFADGVAVKKSGEETYRLCNQFLDGIVTVDTDEICAAIRDIYEDTRSIVEPAGALAVAGIRSYLATNPLPSNHASWGPWVAINCGANMNFDRLRHVSERAALGTNQEALFCVELPEEKGSFLKFSQVIGDAAITEFNYRANDTKTARIFLGLETDGTPTARKTIVATLSNAGYKIVDLTDDEVAKLHVRHLAAGAGSAIENERLYRFRFPERKGALADFLTEVGSQWNISLFHYRNHGSDYGRVLAGVQVPADTAEEFMQHLENVGYTYWDETENSSYKLFLQ